MKKLIAFFSFVYVGSWLLWLPGLVNTHRSVAEPLLFLGMFAGFVPSIMGLIYIRQDQGRLRQVFKGRISLKGQGGFLLLLGGFPLLAGLSYLASRVIFHNQTPPLGLVEALVSFLVILLVGGALGEEFGWRAYALETLDKKFTRGQASLILGLVWSFWHLPLFFIDGTVQASMPIWQFVIQNTLIAFYYSPLYRKTRNMSLMILLHGVLNTSSAIFPYWTTEGGRYIGLLLLILYLPLYRMIIDKLGGHRYGHIRKQAQV